MGRRQTRWRLLERLPESYAAWLKAPKAFGLSILQTQMARELGVTIKKLEDYQKLPPSEAFGWVPLGEYIEKRYLKEFGRELPAHHLDLETQLVKDWKSKVRAKSERRAALDRKRKATKEGG